MSFTDELKAFAAARGLTMTSGGTTEAFVLAGGERGRQVTMSQGTLLHPRGGALLHFRLCFEPFPSTPSWMVTPQGATRWDGNVPSAVAPSEVPHWSRIDELLTAFGAEVKAHWQLKLGEQNRLFLEALARANPRAWELAWQVLDELWCGAQSSEG